MCVVANQCSVSLSRPTQERVLQMVGAARYIPLSLLREYVQQETPASSRSLPPSSWSLSPCIGPTIYWRSESFRSLGVGAIYPMPQGSARNLAVYEGSCDVPNRVGERLPALTAGAVSHTLLRAPAPPAGRATVTRPTQQAGLRSSLGRSTFSMHQQELTARLHESAR
jgi:hypothetical protein